MSSSPLTEDGACFKSNIDESCWTPPNVSFTYANDFTMVVPSHISPKFLLLVGLLSSLNVLMIFQEIHSNFVNYYVAYQP